MSFKQADCAPYPVLIDGQVSFGIDRPLARQISFKSIQQKQPSNQIRGASSSRARSKQIPAPCSRVYVAAPFVNINQSSSCHAWPCSVQSPLSLRKNGIKNGQRHHGCGAHSDSFLCCWEMIGITCPVTLSVVSVLLLMLCRHPSRLRDRRDSLHHTQRS